MDRSAESVLPHRSQEGFTLLEVLMAVALFGLMMVGLVNALNLIGEAAILSGQKVNIDRNLKTLLTEASKAAQFEEGTLYLGQTGVEGESMIVSYDRVIEELDEMENMDGQLLQSMWHIMIVASYEQDGEIVERIAETYRYEPLYQANR